MTKKIIIFGLASNKILKELYFENTNTVAISLLDYLLKHGITVASSCKGEGKCKKCVVNSNLLSCQIDMNNLPKKEEFKVEIAYL